MIFLYIVLGGFIGYMIIKATKTHIEFKKSTNTLPDIIYQFTAIFYPLESRKGLLLKYLNQEKLYAKIKIVESGEYSTFIAQARAMDLDLTNEINHSGIGKSFILLNAKGSDGNIELISYAHNSPQNVIDALMRSEKHRNAILNGKYDYIGIGCVKDEHGYWIDIIILIDEKTIK